jgi:hypothetical protein
VRQPDWLDELLDDVSLAGEVGLIFAGVWVVTYFLLQLHATVDLVRLWLGL